MMKLSSAREGVGRLIKTWLLNISYETKRTFENGWKKHNGPEDRPDVGNEFQRQLSELSDDRVCPADVVRVQTQRCECIVWRRY